MGREYRAFISYRHAEVDSKVAAEVQRSLERFHIPAEVRQSTGVKSLAPIFRDKEELPVTAELSDDIGDALASSTHLIVICSPRLKESTWCQREIATFLQTHPVQNVLTVLAEGEPYDVIPEVLLKRPKTVTLEDGTTQEVLVDAEPLSCDFRSPKRSEHRTEVTRLAAAMLGVPFDALWRRQQRRRRRLATAAAALAAAVIAYGTWSLITIRSEYRETQRSQSRTLARDAMSLYEDGNALEAIELSLAGLPGEGGERPLVAEAELALQRTSHAYVPPSADEPLLRALVDDYGVVRSFDLGHDIAGMRCSSGGETLVAWSNSGDLACWDVGTGDELYRSDVEEYSLADVSLLDDQRLLVTCWEGVRCVDLGNGTDVWRVASSSAEGLDDISDGIDFYAWEAGVDEKTGRLVILDGSIESRLMLMNVQDGSVQDTIGFDKLEGEPATMATADMAVGEGLCAIPWDGGDGFERNSVLLADLKAGTCRLGDTVFTDIIDLTALPHGRVLVTSAAGDSEDMSTRWRVSSRVEDSLYAYQLRLSCLDVATGKTVWSRDVDLWQVADTISVLPTTLAMGESGSLEAVVWCGANVCVFLDPQTGEAMGRIETAASFKDAWVGPGWTDDAGKAYGTIEGCLTDGSFVVCTPARGQSLSTRRFPAEANCAMTSAAGEFVADGSQVLLNATGVGDDSWTILTNEFYEYDQMAHTSKGLLAFDTFGSDSGVPSAALFDLVARKESWKTALEGMDGAEASYLGQTADGGTLVFLLKSYAQDERKLAFVSTEGGEVSYESVKETLPTATSTAKALCGGQATLAGDVVISTVTSDDDFTDHLYLTDLDTLESTMLDCETMAPSVSGVGTTTGLAIMATNYAEMPEVEDSGDMCYDCVVLDTISGTSWAPDAAVFSGVGGSADGLDAVWGDEGVLYVHAPGEVVAYKRGGSRAFSLACATDAYVGMGINGNELWLCSWDDDRLALRWYDARSGKLLGECHPDVEADLDDRYLAVRVIELAPSAEREAGQFVLMLDSEAVMMDRTGAVFQLIENCYDYDRDSDTFVVRNPDVASSGFGAYGRYSLEELMERSQRLVGDSRMSERRRRELGA